MASVKYYRLTPRAFGYDVTGTGGLMAPGRWHLKGTRILYACNSLEVALFEVEAQRRAGVAMVLQTFEIEEDALIQLAASATDLEHPGPDYPTQERGTEFILLQVAVGAKVPSARIPPDHPDQPTNLLINPKHPDFNRLRITIEPFQPSEDQVQ